MDLVSRWARVSLGIAICSLAGALGCGTASSSSGNSNPSGSTLALSNGSLNFGTVVVGSSATLSDTVTNNSSAAVTIASASISQSVFQFSSPALPLTLSPGQSAKVVVAFAPQAVGTPSGNVVLTTNLASSSQLQIGVSGKAVNAGSLAPSPQSVSFGNVAVGQSLAQTVSVTNPGGSTVTVSQASASSAAFALSGMALPLTIGPGQSTSFTVVFTPKTTGAASGSVSLTGSAALTTNASGATGQQSESANTTVSVSGDGVTPSAGSLVPNPSSVSFGNVQVGSSKNASETITNSGSGSISISQAVATGTGFSISGFTTPATLSAGQSLTFTVTFAPKSAGSPSGNVAITSTASNSTLNVPLSGTAGASGTLSVSPATLSFGTVTVGSTKNLTGSVTAAGSAVTISGASPNSSEFALSGISLPLTLSAGQTANYTVTFAPQSSGTAAATLSFTSNATNGPNTEALSGTGQAAKQHNVSLGWTGSTSTVVGYNVYRGTVSGGPYSLVNSSDPNVSYSDATVQAGQTYFYVVTAVDSQGTESVYSNQAQATVPSP